MLEILIPTLVGVLCFVVILLGRTSNRGKLILNNYFIVILLFVGSIRIIPFLYFITNSNEPAYNQLLFFSIVSSIVVIPLFYIYLNSLILIKPRKWYYHMIIPLLVIILLIAVDSVSRLHFGLFISSYYLLYIISSVILVVKFLREKPNNLIRSAFVKNVKNWIVVLTITYSVTFLILTRSIIVFDFFNNDYNFAESFVLSSIGWLFILTYLMTNRNLFLNNFNNKSIKEGHLNFWSFNAIHKVDSKDSLYNKLKPEEMIQNIIALESNFKIISNNQITLKYISERLNIPVYLLKLLFKYHNSLSVVEYQNVLKVNNAIHFIQNGYLNSFTIDSLSNKVGFNSRITFYKNFKKYVGLSVTEYKNLIG